MAASAIHARHPEAPTKLYLGNRKVSQLEQDGWDAYSLAGLEVTEMVRNGNHIFALDTAEIPVFAFGYARVTSGRTWYVTLNETDYNTSHPTPTFVTIGAVSFRGPGVWDAYCGLDGRARWFGYATGPHAGIGAVALLLDFGACGT